ncbi:chloride channel protein [Desulfovibrio sp. UCD-KL4C]|uniref:chloride channel protein n=1 Tax=Desulfovibrio sp. UCD-KL4C TaxID=2578120 RepID=UPI0025BA96F5|nr:chloride channel protein [Desulfovibrio sp. UCD-KL4C]
MAFAMERLRFANWPQHARWLILSIAVGVVAGVGAVFFDRLLDNALEFFVRLPICFFEPNVGNPLDINVATTGFSLWIIPIATLGGLLSGLLVFNIAPETEGHGTDAMIESFHLQGGFTRKRAPFIKIIASALTIGSGGSAGKEGPIAQIGSGFGSLLATWLNLKPRERRVLLLAGAAGGIGAIFQAPLGAALFVPGVLYRETEYEYEAILPCIISSIMAHAVFSEIYGRHALFHPGNVAFDMPVELIPYAIFGIVCAFVGFIYIKFFYGMRDYFFEKLPMPQMFRPAIGGFMLGCIAYFYPQIIDGGYVWIQLALDGQMIWTTMLVLVFVKIIATSCTISSGGSGGVFGPSVFIGAMLGGAFGGIGHMIAPNWIVNPNSFILVGMGGFFAGVAKVPIASIIMACEMSSSYTLLVPLMLVSTISYLILGKMSLYEKQFSSRLDSPAHINEFARGVLSALHVRDALTTKHVSTLEENLPIGTVVKIVTNSPEPYYPVVNTDGELTGILTINDIRELMFEEGQSNALVAKDVASTNVITVIEEDTLQTALEKMIALNVNELPVVSSDNPKKIMSMLSKQDLITSYYNRED